MFTIIEKSEVEQVIGAEGETTGTGTFLNINVDSSWGSFLGTWVGTKDKDC